jgi:hypothetical protein
VNVIKRDERFTFYFLIQNEFFKVRVILIVDDDDDDMMMI